MRARAGARAAGTAAAARQQSSRYDRQQVIAWLHTLDSMQLKDLNAVWLKRCSAFSQGISPTTLNGRSQPIPQDAALVLLLSSVSCKLLNFLCGQSCLEQGAAASRQCTSSKPHRSGSTASSTAGSSSGPSAEADLRQIAASLAAHILTAVPTCLAPFAKNVPMAASAATRVFAGTGEPRLSIPVPHCPYTTLSCVQHLVKNSCKQCRNPDKHWQVVRSCPWCMHGMHTCLTNVDA